MVADSWTQTHYFESDMEAYWKRKAIEAEAQCRYRAKTQRLTAEVANLKKGCAVCLEKLDAKELVIIMPCKHAVMCDQCLVGLYTAVPQGQIAKCPMCISPIESYFHPYFNA